MLHLINGSTCINNLHQQFRKLLPKVCELIFNTHCTITVNKISTSQKNNESVCALSQKNVAYSWF